MKYLEIPGDSTAVIWQDDERGSGVIRESDAGWPDYQRWLASGNQTESIQPPDIRSIEELRSLALAAINAMADFALTPITSQYPATEIDSWSEQCLEARAWLSDATSATPLVDTIAGALESALKEEFCQAILDKANRYKVAVGGVIAWRRACTEWVEKQSDRESLITFAPQFPEVPHAS